MKVYGIDQLKESMVKILDSEKKTIAGSGFIIRSDGYLITCHHVICHLASLDVEYQGQEYEAEWCGVYSNPEVDIAILKINVKDAKAVPIINPQDLSTPVTVYGFPPSKEKNFPDGFDVPAQNIRRSASINTLSTYRSRERSYNNPWNILPKGESMFRSCRIDTSVDPGISGGPVFAEDLSGVVGVIQCSKSGESYVIRWDNILEELDKLGLEPQKKAVCQFLEDVEDDFKYIRLFHTPQEIALKDQYIPVQVTLERKYLHEVETTGGYVESEVELKRAYALKGMDEESQRSQVDWEEAREQNQRIMVLADPGMGKSTLLRIETMSNAQRERQKLLEKKETVDEVVFPLFLRLSDLAETTTEIIDAIPILIQRRYPTTSAAIAPLLKEKIETGKCLLLLDALDEVPKTDRNRLAENLNRFARNYPCPIIATSRIVGYSGSLVDDTQEVEIVPFSQKQTEQYIETWFTNAADFINDDTVSAEGLIRELRNKPQIRGLVQNPLLLSLLCSLYQEKELMLPARRSQIYEKTVNYMLGEWRARHSKQQSEEGWIIAKTELLEELAYHFSCEGKEIFSLRELRNKIEEYLRGDSGTDFRDSRTSDLIKELSEEDGIIQKLSREGDKYLFLHRTFQEYLTACYLNRAVQENQTAGIALAKTHLWDYDWHETLSLLAGMMKNPIPLLDAIEAEKDDIFSTLLLLAGRSIAECDANSQPLSAHPLVAEIINKIFRLWLSNPSFGFIKSVVVAIGQANPQMLECFQKGLNNIEYGNINRAEAIFVLGKIGGEKAVELLIPALKDENSTVRWWAAGALGKIGSEQAVELLINALQKENEDHRVREMTVWALGKIGSEQAVDPLIRALMDEDSYVRGMAASALGYMGREQEVLYGLIKNLKDENSDYNRWRAADILGKIRSEKAVDPLIHALTDREMYVRGAAADALGKIGSKKAVDPLIYALTDKKRHVKKAAVDALGKLGDEKAVEPLIKTFKDKDSGARWWWRGGRWWWRVADVGDMDSEKAVDPSIQAFSGEPIDVRERLTIVNREIGSKKQGYSLIQGFDDEYIGVTERVTKALGKIDSEKAVDLLIQVLKSEYSEFRGWAAVALGKTGSEKAMEPLIQALQGKHEYHSVKREAAEALGEIRSPQAVEPLIQTLKDADSGVRRGAAEALEKISSLEKVDSLEILEKLIKLPGINIYNANIFPLARTLAVRHSKEKVSFIPVYPEVLRANRN